jgi:hypothetical protein
MDSRKPPPQGIHEAIKLEVPHFAKPNGETH